MYANIRLKPIGVLLAFIVFFSLIFTMCGFIFSTQEETKQQVKLPILMYHSLQKDSKMQGTYVISPDDFERDMKYLKDKGYTSVTFQQLLEFVEKGTPLPEKPIMITFDDGYYNNILYGSPILKKYGFTAVISPIVSCTQEYSNMEKISPVYGCAGWEELKTALEDKTFTVENHSYNLHSLKGRKGISKLSGETYESYKSTVGGDILKAQNLIYENLGFKPICFTYPYGAYDDYSQQLVKELGFSASMICTEKLNIITGSSSLYNLGRYIVTPENSAEEILKRISLEK